MIKVSAIVPVFNEEKTVAKVVEALLASPLIDEVVCVNDGSVDRSHEVLKSFGKKIKLLHFRENRGKGFALAEGAQAAEGEIVAFFDGDLITLSEEHIEGLLTPLVEGKARSVLGYHPAKLSDHLVNHLSGERAFFREDLLPFLDKMQGKRFGVEVFLNNQFKGIMRILLPELQGVPKSEKFPPREAVRQLIREGVEIAYEMGRQEKVRLQDLKLLERLTETEIKVLPDFRASARKRRMPQADLYKAFDFSPLQEKIAKIKNNRVRSFLSEYFKTRLAKTASRFRNRF